MNTLQQEDPATIMTVLSSLPEDVESMDMDLEGSVRISSSRMNPHKHSGNKHALEESWNGLFLSTSISDLNSAPPAHSPTTPCVVASTSNKKMGHASFTDLGLYAKHNPGSSATLTAKDIQAAKAQFMKLRLQRMLKSQTHLPSSLSSSKEACPRLHQSDSALLRKSSDMDTTELEGAWYKAKHPRQCFANSAPAGSLDYVSSSSSS